jgi:hypothetical protein
MQNNNPPIAKRCKILQYSVLFRRVYSFRKDVSRVKRNAAILPCLQQRLATNKLKPRAFRSALCTLLTLLGAGYAACSVSAQQQEHPTSSESGASTGRISTPVYDAQHRPVTAGGFVANGPMVFKDAAQAAGLTSWHHTMGSPQKNYILETAGSGVALLDYDNDGWLDIYLVNGSTAAAEAGHSPAPRAALFHNNHDGTFTDVAGAAGVTNDRWGFGAVVGDFDNDGWPDLYITNFGKNRLYRNNHDGTFTDVAVKAGVAVDSWSTGATFGDYDGDGKLDLFVPGYVAFDLAHPPEPGTANTSFHTCQFRGVSVSCGPRGLPGARDYLFHNNGDGTFTDVSKAAGVDDAKHFYGFTGLFVDVTGDGKPDLLVANDSTPNYLYVNQGDGTFLERSLERGFAYNGEGREVASMGLAVGDYRNNGSLDLALTDFSDDYKLLFRNDGHGNFTDVSEEAGIAASSEAFLGWGVAFFDYDNDGWKDLFMVNGHIYPAADKLPWGTSYKQRPLLFHNRRGKDFDAVPPVRGSGLAVVSSGRGAAVGDLFNDGKLDVVINNLDGVPTLLRAVDNHQGHWIEMKLIGGPGSPRDAVGATVSLEAGGLKQREDVLSGGSYLSSNDQRVHFGIGTAIKIAKVSIRWPSGKVEEVALPSIDAVYTIMEGKGVLSSTPSASVNTSPKLRTMHAKQ